MENNEVIDKKEAKKDPAEKTPESKKTKKGQKLQEEKIEKLEKELCDVKDSWMRTLAEYDNFRKRSQKEKEATYLDSQADVLTKLLPVLDNFERAEENADSNLEDYRKGIDMIVKQLIDTMAGMKVEAYGKAGEAFDPNLHNAVMHIEDERYGQNEIVDVFQKGYKMGDRILRPASVRVAN